jgi:hypothetical protein
MAGEDRRELSTDIFDKFQEEYPYLKSKFWKILFEEELYHSNRLIKSYTRGHAMDTKKMAELEKEAVYKMMDAANALNNDLIQEQPKHPMHNYPVTHHRARTKERQEAPDKGNVVEEDASDYWVNVLIVIGASFWILHLFLNT